MDTLKDYREMKVRLENGSEPIEHLSSVLYGYTDRKMAKWQGFLLSDHTAALHELELEEFRITNPKEEQSMEEIGKMLYQAYVTDSPVLIQANVLNNGNYYQDLACKIIGYSEDEIYLLLKDDRSTYCTLEQIRNVEFMDKLQWHEKFYSKKEKKN